MAKSLLLGVMAVLGSTAGMAKPQHHLAVGEVELAVKFNPDMRAAADGRPWIEWLRTSLQATRSVTGSFPREQVTINLHASPRGSNAIAFGQVRRSNPPQIKFYVDPNATLEDLNKDWRGYHEFAHLLIPFPGNDDIWFTEGFASYYQYLLQSRAGVVSQNEAWRNLLAGFERGLRDTSGRGQTLRELSPDMWSQRAYRRVYWTGAAFFLRVDTRLRAESGGEHSLDSTLAAFHECCIDQRRRWNARQLIDRMGALSIPEVWQQEYRATIDQRAEPAFADALDRLGISSTAFGLRFSNVAGHRAMRDQIAGPVDRDAAGRLVEIGLEGYDSTPDPESSAP
ncbi:MAG: hypothetical protein RQ741_04110 [Wenzhouxiangellaceae bacterium]|nr:hypothetical protein [Wenzhouxiangellaceae bacterium]